MANIKDRIEKIKPYFKAMQVQEVDGENVIYVVVSFPEKWIIANEIEKKFNVSIARQDDGLYYFCAEMEVGFETVFDAIEYNIQKMTSAQERAKLLRDKIEELKELFLNEEISLESLRTITFNYKMSKPKKKSQPKTEKNNEPETTEEKGYGEDRQEES